MDKVILSTSDAAVREKVLATMKAGYEPLPDIAADAIPELCAARGDIHGVLIDRDWITPEQVGRIRAAVKNGLFPILLICDALSEAETNMWLGAGVTEFLPRTMPASLLGKRVGNVVWLYCVSRSLSDQSHDSLTGLYNRAAFYHYAEEMMLADPDAEYTIIISDIENFKLINGRFGEAKGDELLRYVGRSLGAVNRNGVLFARYGGDRFVGILKRPSPEAGQDEAPLVSGMEMMYANAPVEHFAAKFGIYDNVDKSLPVSIMCDRALMALNSIKHQYDRMLAKYDPQMQMKLNREQRIIDSMETALTEEQFVVYYQPKHDIKTSALIGVEALVRWIHPAYGFMSPGEFIPLFERNGFISKLDKYVWNRVCRDARDWLDQGLPPIPVSVNASRRDLLQDGFRAAVEEPLKRCGVDPKYFHMEITESIYMEDAQILAPVIDQLRDMGIGIELDDFGSGFSSLGILSKLPLDIIKLDISLIRNLETQPLIVESIIKLMHTLGYRVIAEGVENICQLETLRDMDCDQVQGYCYSKPLTLSGLKEYALNCTEK